MLIVIDTLLITDFFFPVRQAGLHARVVGREREGQRGDEEHAGQERSQGIL